MSIVRDHGLLVFLVLSICIPLSAPAQNPAAKLLSRPYQKWIDEDVRYLITDQERADFDKLTTDEQRDKFVEAFWERRNPTPGSAKNTFKEEHYRRIGYTNTHFAAGVPGWKTDRGRVYITYGAPDKIKNFGPNDIAHFPDTIQYPSQTWHYRLIHNLARDVSFEFVDTCRCGKFDLYNDPTKDLTPPKRKNENERPRNVFVANSWEEWLDENVRRIVTGSDNTVYW